mmetsp:Transcript_51625/g.159972  ORF Transcript_51625/g.159972 Transcript_51625/m.159972 type:complete len:211 (-) Transcript_51625:1103-1735(-)
MPCPLYFCSSVYMSRAMFSIRGRRRGHQMCFLLKRPNNHMIGQVVSSADVTSFLSALEIMTCSAYLSIDAKCSQSRSVAPFMNLRSKAQSRGITICRWCRWRFHCAMRSLRLDCRAEDRFDSDANDDAAAAADAAAMPICRACAGSSCLTGADCCEPTVCLHCCARCWGWNCSCAVWSCAAAVVVAVVLCPCLCPSCSFCCFWAGGPWLV